MGDELMDLQALRTPEQQQNDDAIFRSPSISTRGRKRRPTYTDDGVMITPTVLSLYLILETVLDGSAATRRF